MSFVTKNLRHRFNKTDRNEDRKESAKYGQACALTDEDSYDLIDAPEDLKGDKIKHPSELAETQSIASVGSLDTASGKWQSSDEKKVFEDQLNQLQEQLMMVMIENQTLQSELHQYKSTSEMEKLRSELIYERHRSEQLEKTLSQIEKKKSRHKVHRSHSDLSGRNRLAVPADSSLASSSTERLDSDDGQEEFIPKPKKKRFFDPLMSYIMSTIVSVIEDFTEEPPPVTEGDPEGDPLTVKKLKDNIKRFGTEAKPYVNTVKGFYDILAWKSPPYTLIVFVVYMYSVWNGWFLPVFFFCLSFRLFINYLRHRGWNISFNFFETVEEPKDADEKDLGVSDKLNLVMQVARKVQNFLGEVADGLEKIKSLLTWRHPEASRQLFFTVTLAFITSCIFPTSLLFFFAGLGLGVKLFIIDYVYERFPRVKRKYDSTWRMWKELPTDVEFEKRYVKSEMDKYILPYNSDVAISVSEISKTDSVSMDDKSFCELFSLPESECPLPGWHGGRRCTLINREKSLTAAFKNGRLYLTHSFLCFERTKVPSPKNIVIPLTDIARLEKAKPYAWIPGGGMAIEIAVVGTEKPFLFGGLLNRDELYDSICEAGYKKLKQTSKDDSSLPWNKKPKVKRHHSQKYFQPFSLPDTYQDSD